jgi:hypothetical protein
MFARMLKSYIKLAMQKSRNSKGAIPGRVRDKYLGEPNKNKKSPNRLLKY